VLQPPTNSRRRLQHKQLNVDDALINKPDKLKEEDGDAAAAVVVVTF